MLSKLNKVSNHFIIGIISIYVLFPKKNIVILSILLSFQLIDLSSGLKHYFNGNQYKVSSEDKYIDYEYWIKISKQFENYNLVLNICLYSLLILSLLKQPYPLGF